MNVYDIHPRLRPAPKGKWWRQALCFYNCHRPWAVYITNLPALREVFVGWQCQDCRKEIK